MVTASMPGWAKKYLQDDAFTRVEAAVRNAEQATSGEIVPMIVKRSVVSGHLVTQSVLILIIAGVMALADGVWPPWAPLIPGIWALLPLLFPTTFLRLWTSTSDMTLQVQRRAQLEFHQAGLTKTTGKTGILLFVSLDERSVVVLADKAISDQLPADTWQGIVDQIVASIKSGDLTQGLCTAIARCSELVAPHFPRASNDRNELGDGLVILP